MSFLWRSLPGVGLVCCVFSAALSAQPLDNKALTGKYFFRELLIGSDAAGNVNDTRSLLGTLTFNAAGQYTFTAQQAVGTAASVAVTGTGTYTVAPVGTVTLRDPLRNTLTMNARLGDEALIGSTTETPDNVFDLLIAIPAPTATQSLASFNGAFSLVSLEFPNATPVKNALISLQANGAGLFTGASVFGHAASVNGGVPATQALTGGTYAVMPDGSGMAAFGNSAPLLTGSKSFYLSKSGNVVLGASTAAGAQDLVLGIRSVAPVATNASWSGLFWTAGLRVAGDGTTGAYAGSLNAIPSVAKTTLTRRLHQAGSVAGGAASGAIDVTLVNNYNLAASGTGTSELTQVALGAAGNLFVTAGVSASDPNSYELNFGMRTPNIVGTGLFLNPAGVVNGASLAPVGAPISPGEFVSLYSLNIGPKAPVAAKPPYPTTLGGVGVTVNGVAAPLHFVGPNQINLLVPYAMTGAKATLVVTNAGTISNAVDVPLAATTPGVFSLDQSGTGFGAVLHSDFTPVNDDTPARRGETVSIFLTGLGAVTPSVRDGTAGGGNPLSVAASPVRVLMGGKTAPIVFAGLAPGFPGLYQLNATVPLDVLGTGRLTLAIVTPEAFHCEVDLPVQ